MDVAIAFLAGIFIGSAAGIFTFALLAAAKMEDDIISLLSPMKFEPEPCSEQTSCGLHEYHDASHH